MDGQINEMEVVESSGHHVLDEVGKKAILRSVPLPGPPTPHRSLFPSSSV
ncbi:MAG: TonB C-terminal domain-containing protein [Desulfovibrionales bacterium]|nr:TonB C-terminal domain-containing protein [Desulfovibrionales bacterium]